MRYDIKNMNIWRQDPRKEEDNRDKNELQNIKVEDLNLSVRSFNSLKRAECHTVGDIMAVMDENGEGLRKIRNLGARSEAEIKEKLELLDKEYPVRTVQPVTNEQNSIKRVIFRPTRSLWDREIGEFHLSKRTENKLRNYGVSKVGDLYVTHPHNEPGWYAVRELFRRIAECSE